jgi:ABC-type uncharacterized transport system substrate-binding protein
MALGGHAAVRTECLFLVASLARPGGKTTGHSLMAPELSPKRLDILHTLSPGISRIAILWDSSNPGMAELVRETKSQPINHTSCCTPSVPAISMSWMRHLPTF